MRLPHFFILALSVQLAACVTTNSEAPERLPDAYKYSSVSTADPAFAPPKNATIAWQRDLVVSDLQALHQVSPATRTYIQQQITQQLQSLGFQVQASPTDSQYVIGAALVLDDSNLSHNIMQFMELFPGLSNSLPLVEYGSLLVAIAQPSEFTADKLMWRGVVNAAVLPEPLPEDQQKARIHEYVQNLLKQIPMAQP